MKLLLIALLFCTGSTVSARSTGSNGTDTGTLQGTIIDAETKKPVAHAAFSATIKKTAFFKEIVTDANGHFKIHHVPAGEHIFVIDKVGYRACKKEAVVVKEGVVLKLEFEVVEAEEEFHEPLISPITIHSF